ncbi:MAG: hypothetical protein DRJ96_02590 [Thermoprotei archaeon]|nr:MAG: hypothetical protein DRJ96_02590 [Thermoprotei archaeon]
MSYVTITAGLNASGEEAKLLLSTAWLFKLATHRVLSHAKALPTLPATKIAWKNTFRRVAYDVIPNRRYADSSVVLVMGIYESCRRLGVDFREVELGDWLMFQQSEKEYPPRNITLKSVEEVWVTAFNYDRDSRRIKLRATTSGVYRELIGAVLKERQPYNPRIVVRSWNVRSGELFVKGELQVGIPKDFYYGHVTKYSRSDGGLYGGVDVNTDRLNLAVVDKYGRLRDARTFWFEEASRRGCSRRRARSIIGMAVHSMLRYAYHHGVKMLFLENPEVLGKLRLLWIRNGRRLHENYNWRVSVFRRSIIDLVAVKAPLYSIKVYYVDPKGTTHSREHDEIARRYGLDKHTASAYLIALRGMKRHTTVQKATV